MDITDKIDKIAGKKSGIARAVLGRCISIQEHSPMKIEPKKNFSQDENAYVKRYSPPKAVYNRK